MPSILRSRLALLALLGAFLIPIGMSSLRGLTHVLTCNEEAKQPFTVIVTEGKPEVLSSIRIGQEDTGRLCGGLSLETQARAGDGGDVELILPITNHTEHPWQGTVSVLVGKTTIPVDIGEIPPGETRQDSIDLELREGTTELSGSLLIGP
jgi:hypothetical protein